MSRMLVCTLMLAFAAAAPQSRGAQVDEDLLPALAEGHTHEPVDVDARPIVARSKIPLIRPRRLLVDADGNLLIADMGAGAVLKVSPDEHVTIVADDLDEPAGLALDPLGNLYVSLHADGAAMAGAVLRIGPMGDRTVYADGLSGPTALAFDPQGNLFVAAFHSNSIERVSPGGTVTTFTHGIPTPAALAFDTGGTLFVASSTEGAVYRVNTMGTPTLVTQDLELPSDLAFDPEGHLIVANYGGTSLSYVDADGRTRPFAVVPKGTICHAFDTAGNLLMANWDLQFLMRVTTTFEVPCPHCGKPIPIRLRPKPKGGTSPGRPRPII